jgi:hypothetical protein
MVKLALAGHLMITWIWALVLLFTIADSNNGILFDIIFYFFLKSS